MPFWTALGAGVVVVVGAGLATAALGMCAAGCAAYTESWTVYVLVLAVLLFLCFSVNEAAGLYVWKWRANPKLAQTSALARAAAQVTTKAIGGLGTRG